MGTGGVDTPWGDRRCVPIALCFDVEPDAKVFGPDSPSGWTGFENLLEWVPLLRERLATITGAPVHFGWALRMDPQIALAYGSASYIAERYRPQLDDLLAAGDAIGLHPHAWRWQPARRLWVADHQDQAWVDECLDVAFRAYEAAFGTVPMLFRYGAQFMSTHTMNRLADHGLTIDLTVEPGEPPNRDADLAGTTCTGMTGDFRWAPRSPYRPSRDDYRQPAPMGGEGIWELPLTSSRWVKARDERPSMQSRLNHPLRTARGARRRLVRSWGLRRGRSPAPAGGAYDRADGHRLLATWPGGPDPAAFWAIAFDAASELEKPYLAFAVRTETGSKVDQMQRFGAILVDELVKDPRAEKARFCTPEEALATMGLLKGTP